MAVNYDAAAELARVPLEDGEVQALQFSGGAALLNDRVKLRHFLSRVRATMEAHVREQRATQREMDQILASVGQSSDPFTAAVEALSRCSVEDQQEIYDVQGRRFLAEITQARQEAETAAIAAASATNRARMVLSQALEIPGLPEETRHELRRCLDSVPLMRAPEFGPAPAGDGAFRVRAGGGS